MTKLLLLVALTLGGIAQTPPALSSAAVAEDLAIFQAALEQLHPNFRDEGRRADLRRFMEQAEGRLRNSPTTADVYRVLASSAPIIADGHTTVASPQSFRHAMDAALLLPLRVFVDGQSRVWSAGHAGSAVPPGSRIVSIDGVDAAALVKMFEEVEPRDGQNRSRVPWVLSRRARFNQMLAGLSGERTSYAVRFTRPGSAHVDSADLAGVPLDLLHATDARTPAAYGLRYERDGAVAVLTIPAFSQEAGASMRESFAAIAASGARALIIDLRDNGGGQDALGKQLFAHLARAPFGYYRDLRVTATPAHAVFAQVAEKLAGLPKGPDGIARVPSPNLGIQQPEAVRFNGSVFVLVNGGSFSATSEFAAVAQAAGRVTIVGEETGGGYCSNNSGAMYPVTLPNTKVRLTVPLVRYEMDVPCGGREGGVTPDVFVPLTIEDVIAGRDPQMARALALGGG